MFPPADNLSGEKEKEFTFDVEVKVSFRSPKVFRTVVFFTTLFVPISRWKEIPD